MRTVIGALAVFSAIGLALAQSSISSAQTLRDRVRTTEGEKVVVVLTYDIPRQPLEDLTAESDVVCLGRLSRSKSYLSPNESDIYTDYHIAEPRVIAGTLAMVTGAVGTVSPLTVRMIGGEVFVDGKSVLQRNTSFAPLISGEYLLFLKHDAQPGRYRVHNGGLFAIQGEELTPLAGYSLFPELKGISVSTLLARVERAARRR